MVSMNSVIQAAIVLGAELERWEPVVVMSGRSLTGQTLTTVFP